MNSSAGTLMPLEQHPYNYHRVSIPSDTRLLVVGTAPPPRFSLPRPPFGELKKGYDADFFYGSGSNYLWQYLKLAAGEPDFAEPGTKEACDEATEDMMKDYLSRHRIWMQDVLQSYCRKEGKQWSSSDSAIKVDDSRTEFLNFSAVFERAIEVERVVFTSQKAAEWFFVGAPKSYLSTSEVETLSALYRAAKEARKSKDLDRSHTDEFCRSNFGNRLIRFHIAPSPSGSAGASGRQWFVDIYRRILFEQE